MLWDTVHKKGSHICILKLKFSEGSRKVHIHFNSSQGTICWYEECPDGCRADCGEPMKC